MSILRSRYYSLSTKLSVTTSLITSFIITIIAIYVLVLKSDQVTSRDKHDVELSLTNTALTINNRLSLVESTLTSNLWNIDRYLTEHQTDSVTSILNRLLTLNADMIGCGVSYNAGNDTDAKPYILYVSRNNEARKYEIDQAEINAANGEYHWLNESYQTASPHWTSAHLEPDDQRLKVCSYTVPLSYDSERGKLLVFADIPVDAVGEVINDSQSEFVVRAMLVDDDGNCLYTANYVDNNSESYIRLSAPVINEMVSNLEIPVREGEHGTFDLTENGIRHLTFFDVINGSGWTLFYVSDFSTLSTDLAQSTRILALIFVVMMVILFFVLSAVINHMTKPLKQFSDSALEISKGNFNAELPSVSTKDEMALLHDSFDKMKRSIVKYTHELEESTRQQAFMVGELQVASRIQDDLLPKIFPPFPERNDIDIRARLIPAKQIGGDLYNYFIHNNKVYFIVADVSGKSVPAALVMAIANNMFITISPQTDNPATIMRELNITTCANNENSGYFITALVGILDLKTGTLQLCNAGHDPAILIDEDGNTSMLKIKPNLPVGVINDYNYTSVTLDLKGHTRLVMYTDGITEAENAEGTFFGSASLLRCVERNYDSSLSEIIENVVNEVSTFALDKERADDITIMVLDYKPSDKEMPESITIFNDIKEISKVTDFANAVADVMQLEANARIKLNLALEEAVSNIIKYSLTQKHSGHNIITLYASTHNNIITVIISDRGSQFDPTSAKAADIDEPLEDRSIGGLGITLMRGITTDMRYLWQNNHNYLTLVFDFT